MTHGSLFSGIGGFDLAAEWMGWENMFHCEINKFCQKVLKYHFPKSISYADIKTTDFTIWRGRIDVLTGGFPCQPNSRAGKQQFQKDERNLWHEYIRVFDEVQPRWGIGENVPGIIDSEYQVAEIKRNFQVIGYNLFTIKIPAYVVGANHNRERIWFIAYSNSVRRKRRIKRVQQAFTKRHDTKDMLTEQLQRSEWRDGLPRPEILRNDDGIPKRLAIETIRAYGNAIVPQVAYEIFKTIEEYDKLTNKQINL